MSIAVDKDQLASYFPYPCESFYTTGTREGVILKFVNMYLKIYDDKEDIYLIEVYRYGWQNPISVDKVPSKRIREYATQLCRDCDCY